jgi:hypothetical protein
MNGALGFLGSHWRRPSKRALVLSRTRALLCIKVTSFMGER